MSYHLVKCRQIYQIKVVKTMVSVWYHADLTNLTLMTFYVLNYHFILLYRKWINSILVIKCLIKIFYEICKSSFPPVKSLWTQQLLYWGFVKVVPLGPCPMCFLPNFTENIKKIYKYTLHRITYDKSNVYVINSKQTLKKLSF